MVLASPAAPSQPVVSPAPPILVVEAADSLAGLANQVRELDTGRLASIMRLTGLSDAGGPIRVLLVPEDAALARDTPPRVAAFADGAADLVVLFPATHRVVSLQLAGDRSVSRGGARADRARQRRRARSALVQRGPGQRGRTDLGPRGRSRVAWEVIAGGRLSATALEGLFYGSDRDVARAYALSDAVVRDLLERYGPDAPARILARMARGAPFEVALYEVTGYPVDGVMLSFWSRHDTWKSWISAAGHPFTQWSVITLLALAAIWSHRRRRRERAAAVGTRGTGRAGRVGGAPAALPHPLGRNA